MNIYQSPRSLLEYELTSPFENIFPRKSSLVLSSTRSPEILCLAKLFHNISMTTVWTQATKYWADTQSPKKFIEPGEAVDTEPSLGHTVGAVPIWQHTDTACHSLCQAATLKRRSIVEIRMQHAQHILMLSSYRVLDSSQSPRHLCIEMCVESAEAISAVGHVAET